MARQKRTRARKHKAFGKLQAHTVSDLEAFRSKVYAERKRRGLPENAYVPLRAS
jgi:hypothetical protein